MTEAAIAGQLHRFFTEVFPHPGRQIGDDTDLLNEWFVDSFGVIQTVQFKRENLELLLLFATCITTTRKDSHSSCLRICRKQNCTSMVRAVQQRR